MTTAKKVLIIDDDQDIGRLVGMYLRNEGYEVEYTPRGDEAVPLAKQMSPDLIILDVMLPGYDGVEICRDLRRFTDVPILFLSGKKDETDIVVGLMAGGDDYITKPFRPRELVARVKVQFRRRQVVAPAGAHELQYPDLSIDLLSRTVMVRGERVVLSAKEFDLLALMAKNPNRVYQVEELFELVWGEHSLGDTRTLIVHISNLRKKIETDPTRPQFIVTVRGVGYRFNPYGPLNP
ncbi:MAG: DNA-binding response regulator [Paenibacillaceae bacterium ZCTH02-B3]|nr:MAG: DNA-binding response regulator [Paenibacillaceae bacterium ZCTH02-B3]